MSDKTTKQVANLRRHCRDNPSDKQSLDRFAAITGSLSGLADKESCRTSSHGRHQLVTRLKLEERSANRYARREPQRKKYFEVLEKQRKAAAARDRLTKVVDAAVANLAA